MKWTKITYAKELKKGYWDLEPHYNYYALMEFLGLFETICTNNMSVKDIRSLLYGKFVCEGKPIKKGFYEHMNLVNKIADEIMKRVTKK